MGRIGAGADDDKIVPGDLLAGQPVAGGHKLRLRLGVVHQHQVRVAMRGGRQCLPGALGNHMHLDAGLLRELRQDVSQQPAVFDRGC
jgi:hypothetical protein